MLFFDEFQSPNLTFDIPSDHSIIRIIKTQPDLVLYDRIATPEKESLADLVLASFQMAVDEINQWEKENQRAVQWGAYKDTQINHYLRLDPLSAHVDVGGSRVSVNAISKTKGPSWRYIVSLEKPALKIWGIYPGGQSGNPGSRFYTSFIPYWAEGKYYPMAFGSTLQSIEKQAMFTTTLNSED